MRLTARVYIYIYICGYPEAFFDIPKFDQVINCQTVDIIGTISSYREQKIIIVGSKTRHIVWFKTMPNFQPHT